MDDQVGKAHVGCAQIIKVHNEASLKALPHGLECAGILASLVLQFEEVREYGCVERKV